MTSHPHEICGRITKDIPPTPIIFGEALIGLAEHSGDDFVCKRHAIQLKWFEVFHANADEKALIGTEAEFIADGYTVHRDENCTLTWDDENPCYAIGGLLFVDD